MGVPVGRESGDGGGSDRGEVDDPGVVGGVDGDGEGLVEAAAGEADWSERMLPRGSNSVRVLLA